LIAINTALLVGAGYWSLTHDFAIRAEHDIDLNLRTLTLAFGEAYPDAKIGLRDGIIDRVFRQCLKTGIRTCPQRRGRIE
jgi:methyl-accepting chemotaxis protein